MILNDLFVGKYKNMETWEIDLIRPNFRKTNGTVCCMWFIFKFVKKLLKCFVYYFTTIIGIINLALLNRRE